MTPGWFWPNDFSKGVSWRLPRQASARRILLNFNRTSGIVARQIELALAILRLIFIIFIDNNCDSFARPIRYWIAYWFSQSRIANQSGLLFNCSFKLFGFETHTVIFSVRLSCRGSLQAQRIAQTITVIVVQSTSSSVIYSTRWPESLAKQKKVASFRTAVNLLKFCLVGLNIGEILGNWMHIHQE